MPIITEQQAEQKKRARWPLAMAGVLVLLLPVVVAAGLVAFRVEFSVHLPRNQRGVVPMIGGPTRMGVTGLPLPVEYRPLLAPRPGLNLGREILGFRFTSFRDGDYVFLAWHPD